MFVDSNCRYCAPCARKDAAYGEAESAEMAANSENKSGRNQGTAVQRTFALLELIVSEERPMSLAQLAERLTLPKPTVHRMAARLEADGMLSREPASRNFTIGPRLNALAVDTLTASMRRAPRHAVLAALARETGETCNLGMLDGNGVVYLDRVETQWPLRLQLSVGSHVPLHCTAMGKLFLAHMPKRLREDYYAAAPLERFTGNTITGRGEMEKEAARIRADGVSINNQEYMAGLIGMAAPVPDPANPSRFAAALAIHAPEARLSITEIRKFLPTLKEAAERLSRLLAEPA
jgi:IclR family acetate operon transcriptional repressor